MHLLQTTPRDRARVISLFRRRGPVRVRHVWRVATRRDRRRRAPSERRASSCDTGRGRALRALPRGGARLLRPLRAGEEGAALRRTPDRGQEAGGGALGHALGGGREREQGRRPALLRAAAERRPWGLAGRSRGWSRGQDHPGRKGKATCQGGAGEVAAPIPPRRPRPGRGVTATPPAPRAPRHLQAVGGGLRRRCSRCWQPR